MKKLLTVLGVLILVPQIAMAAWWNPLSWFGGWKIFNKSQDKTQVWEERVQESEKETEDIQVSEVTTTTETSTQDKSIAKPVEYKTEVAPVSSSGSTVESQHKDLLNKFINFKSVTATDIAKTKSLDLSTVASATYKDRIEYLQNFLSILDYEIRAMNLSAQNIDTINKYKARLLDLDNDYNRSLSIFKNAQEQFKKAAESSVSSYELSAAQGVSLKISNKGNLTINSVEPTYVSTQKLKEEKRVELTLGGVNFLNSSLLTPYIYLTKQVIPFSTKTEVGPLNIDSYTKDGTNLVFTIPAGAVPNVAADAQGNIYSSFTFRVLKQKVPTCFGCSVSDPGGESIFTIPVLTTPAPTVTFTASRSLVSLGQSVTFTWSSFGAKSCTATGGEFGGEKSASGTQTIYPTVSGEYKLTCIGEGGTATKIISVPFQPKSSFGGASA